MSMLTKVFVVLLVVFSIAFTTMTVSIVARTANWRDTAMKYEQHARVADTNLQNLIAANAAELASASDAVRRHVQRIGELESNLQETRNQLSERRADLARAASERSSAEAINRGLVAQLSSSEAARAEFQKQRDRLETRNVDLEQRNVDLNDRVNELTARLAVMNEQRRQFEQQINVLRAENERLSSGLAAPRTAVAMEEPAGAALRGVAARTPVAPAPIRGHVASVSGDIITISVGSADGVREGMVFVVHREEEYVGDMKVTLVDSGQSAGRPVGAAFQPRVGDQVTDAAGLSSPRG